MVLWIGGRSFAYSSKLKPGSLSLSLTSVGDSDCRMADLKATPRGLGNSMHRHKMSGRSRAVLVSIGGLRAVRSGASRSMIERL
jgi:hypothetical protein